MPRERRKSFARTWGVTIGFVIVIIGVVITTLTLVNQPLGRPIATPGPSAIRGTGETEFTQNGIDYAASHRFVSINLTVRPIPASRVGLGAHSTATVPANQFGTSLRIIDGTRNVTLTGLGDITVTSAGGSLSTLTFTADGLTVSDLRRRLQQDVPDLGTDAATFPSLFRAIASAGRDGRGYSTTLPATTRLGAPITTDVACDETGTCEAVYTADLTQ